MDIIATVEHLTTIAIGGITKTAIAMHGGAQA